MGEGHSLDNCGYGSANERSVCNQGVFQYKNRPVEGVMPVWK